MATEAAPRPSSAPPPARRGNAAFDRFAFLDGCWSRWLGDWGEGVCWKREIDRQGEAWVGTYSSGGPMGASSETTLRIEYLGDDLVLMAQGSCSPRPLSGVVTCSPEFHGWPRALQPQPPCSRDAATQQLCKAAKDLVVFGEASNELWLGIEGEDRAFIYSNRFIDLRRSAR